MPCSIYVAMLDIISDALARTLMRTTESYALTDARMRVCSSVVCMCVSASACRGRHRGKWQI